MTSQMSDAQTVPRWTRLAIICASGGAGFALALALLVGGVQWYTSRPKPPKPWNPSALKATFDSIDTEGEKNTLVLHYILENETATDYKIEKSGNVVLAVHLERQNALSVVTDENLLRLDWPLIVPAQQRIAVSIHVSAAYPGENQPKADATPDEHRDYEKLLSVYFARQAPNIDDFVLVDEVNRYSIDFPKGW